MKFTVIAVLLAALLLAGVSATTTSRRITRERLAEWHDKLYGTINTLGAPGGGASGLRAWAMMNIAMFDAANLCDEQKYETYLRYDLNAIPVDLDKCEPLAAAAKAAQVVLDSFIPASVVNPTRVNIIVSHATQLTIHLGALPRNTKTANGVTLGAFVGAAVLANRTGDGHAPNNCNSFPNPATPACPNFVPNATEWFKYQYNLPYYPGPPNSPGYPQVKPFAIPAYQDSLFAVPPPPVPGSVAYNNDFAETFGYGTTNPALSTKTTEKSDIARFHDGNFASQIGFAADWLSTSGVTVDGVDLLRGVMLAAISSHDAHATHWLYKYTHYQGRPIVAYRQVPASAPSNLGSFNDANWFPTLTTSTTPEYPSGHSSRSGGACQGIIKAFGDVPVNGNFRTSSYSSPTQGERTYTSVSSFCDEIDNSRIWGGVHWRSATNAGSNLATRVANYVFANVAALNCDE